MSKELAGTIKFTIGAFRKTENGGIVLNLKVYEPDAGKALVLALMQDAFFSADIFLETPEVYGKTA